ncbi:MotA/TolQ/ExbB proton channel family protein [Colwellia sp. C1TZA3]|uniref:MotA/TolQ/ExbB proton channel family protein n=1 Tax=Colwellia sp. C1TZA3 TaxID=2508879 RepID=UPI0011B9B290|nr:MotA/TolQ/ExbB proton channel family protein [Colwellia sp. C1TZA3]TWX73792.1 hypothetical protein ESZ39_02245 [Colwellia sp. C1TZA3]
MNYIFFISTGLLFVICTFSLLRSRFKYIALINSKRNHFFDITGSENTPINSLNDESKALALDMCAITKKKNLTYTSFRHGRVELLRHPSQIIEDFSTSSFKSVPAILTTIGILGTFVGIAIGLKGLTGFGSDSSALVEQASTLIGGLGTAFDTSIAGMGTSFIFMILFSWSVSNTKKAKDNLISFLQGQSVVVTSNDLLHQLVIGQRTLDEQAINMSDLTTTLKELASKPSAITANEYEHYSTIAAKDVCDKIEKLEHSVTHKLTENRIDENQLAQSLSSNIASAFSEEFKKPTELLAEINEENKQINQATYTLTGLLENLCETGSKLSREDLESVIEQKVYKPITDQTKDVTQALSGINIKLADIKEHSISVEALDELLCSNLSHVTSAFRDSFEKPTKLLAEINEENKQINQATYALTGMIETLTATSSKLSKSDLESVIEQKIYKPITDQTKDVTQSLLGINIELADIKEHSISAEILAKLLQNNVSSPLGNGLDLLTKVIESSARDITQLSSSVGNIAENIITEQVLNSALLTQVSQPIDQLTTQVDGHAVDMLTVSNKTVNAVNELAKARADEFEGLIDKMGEEVVLPITTELANTNKVVKDFAEISNELNKSVTKTVEEMAKATATVENFELHTLEKLNEFAKSMDGSLNDFAVNSTAALKSITDEIQTIVEFGSRSITSQTDAFSKIIQESDAIFKQQSQTMTDVGEKSAALMNTAKQELESGLGDINTKVLSMSSTVQIELERFREEYQEKLTSYFTEQNNLLDNSLNAQRDGLNDVVDNFKTVFEEEYCKRSDMLNDLNVHHKQMVDVIERVQTMAKAFGLENASWVDTLQLQSQHVSRQVADLGLSFSKASEEFKLLSGQMRPEMDDYFKRANKSVSEYFSSFDATSSRIYTRLDSAVDLMVTVIEEANQEKNELATLKKKAS